MTKKNYGVRAKRKFGVALGKVRRGIADSLAPYSPKYQEAERKNRELEEKALEERAKQRAEVEEMAADLQRQIDNLQERIKAEQAQSKIVTDNYQRVEEERFGLQQKIEEETELKYAAVRTVAIKKAISTHSHRGGIPFFSSSDARIYATPDGQIIQAEPGLLKHIGYTRENLKDKSLFDLLFPRDSAPVKQALAESRRSSPQGKPHVGFDIGAGILLCKPQDKPIYSHYHLSVLRHLAPLADDSKDSAEYLEISVKKETQEYTPRINRFRRCDAVLFENISKTKQVERIRHANQELRTAIAASSSEIPLIINVKTGKSPSLVIEEKQRLRTIKRIANYLEDKPYVYAHGIKDLPPDCYTLLRESIKAYLPSKLGLQEVTYITEQTAPQGIFASAAEAVRAKLI